MQAIKRFNPDMRVRFSTARTLSDERYHPHISALPVAP
jgi:hypothetical protein